MKGWVGILIGIGIGIVISVAGIVVLAENLGSGSHQMVAEGGKTLAGTVLPTETPFPTPTLVPGHIAQCSDLTLSFVGYSVSSTCPDDSSFQAARGAKFIVVTVKAANLTNDVIELPSVQFRVNHYDSGACGYYDESSFGNVCGLGNLYPGVSCQGREVFEVPEALDPSTAVLYATFGDDANNVSCAEQWPLGQVQH